MKVHELFESINGNIFDKDVINGELPKELKGIELNGDLNCRSCWKLTSLENAPSKVTGNVIISDCRKLSSLEGIGTRYLTSIGRMLSLNNDITSYALGILKIRDMTMLDTWDISAGSDWDKAANII